MEWEETLINFSYLLTAPVICFAALPTVAATLFGTPFGEPLPYKPGKCPERGTIEKVCFISPAKSRTSGMGGLPTKGLPLWAEFSTPEININSKNEIERIDFFRNIDKRKQTEIIESISSRFGKPGQQDMGKWISYEWRSEGIYIRHYCPPDGCMLSFISDSFLKKIERDQEALRERQRNRPVSP